MWLTLGSVLQRVQADPDPERRFAYLMPKTEGPCRFGTYNLAQKLIFEPIGLGDRIRVWSPSDKDYFAEFPLGFSAIAFAGTAAGDLLYSALLDARAVERTTGAATAVYGGTNARCSPCWSRRRTSRCRVPPRSSRCSGAASSASPRCCGAPPRRSGRCAATATLRGCVVVGEIYLRLVPFANGFVVDELETRGLRVSLAPASEWFEYAKEIARMAAAPRTWACRSPTPAAEDRGAHVRGHGEDARLADPHDRPGRVRGRCALPAQPTCAARPC